MIIHFGLHLDGMQPVPARTEVGEVWVGPARMLDTLELRLGLPPAVARRGEALLAYQACLAELDNDSRFYHRSFSVDAIGVARTLLDWRAQWHEAGWRGAFTGPVSQRLGDMAEVERIARDRVPLSSGQRLQRAAAALEQGLSPRIDRIVLHNDLAQLPAAWRHVLGYLEVLAAPSTDCEAPKSSDLGRVQRTLLALADDDAGAKRERDRLAGDDSFIIVRAISRDLSAQAIGEYLLKTGPLDDTVVIAERDGIILDNAFERVGLPRAGFQHYSRFRAVAQVLKLCLGLVWEPISPHLLLQFLIHPVGPLPAHVRSTLAEAVADEPGVGGTAWRAAVETIRDRLLTKFERTEKATAALIEEIQYWLESERFRPDDGAPLTALIERAQRCTSWLARRLNTVTDEQQIELFAAAEAQGEALVAALAALKDRGDTRIPRIALERLVDEVGGRATDPGTFAQAGRVCATTEPASITEPWETVIWWDLAPHVASLSYPWSRAELDELEHEGIELPPVSERIRDRMRGWLNPIMSARKGVVIVVHDRDEGNHPLLSRLLSLFENFNEIRIESALLDDASQALVPVLGVPTDELPLNPLPRPRRWWKLPATVSIPRREHESYSSLNKLIYFPHEWVLNYAARLRTGRAADLPQGNLLYGNLAHRLFEAFFAEHDVRTRLEPGAVRAWLDEYLPRLVTEEGALLCEAGSGVVREQVLSTLENAFFALLEHLRSANIENAVAEHWAEAPFRDVTLRGAIDLLLRDRHGRDVVLDVKWGGESYRAEELEQNRYLQLTTYAYMTRNAAGSVEWPYHAYFIVSTGNVLAHDARVFPGAVVLPPATSEGIESVWERVSATYDWRRGQLADDTIEVNAAGTSREPGFVCPANVLDTDRDPDVFDEYTWLTGWAEGE